MKLGDYLKHFDIPPKKFAADIGVTRNAVYRYVSGERKPEWEVMRRIAILSGWRVMPNDFANFEQAIGAGDSGADNGEKTNGRKATE